MIRQYTADDDTTDLSSRPIQTKRTWQNSDKTRNLYRKKARRFRGSQILEIDYSSHWAIQQKQAQQAYQRRNRLLLKTSPQNGPQQKPSKMQAPKIDDSVFQLVSGKREPGAVVELREDKTIALGFSKNQRCGGWWSRMCNNIEQRDKT